MIIWELAFPTGRYHATPSGRHVNEGAVEWPPSPWRLLRALIATGFNRLGWLEVPSTGASLLRKLAGTLPEYAYPAVSSGHTRHYMPIPGGSAKILDTFVWLGRGEKDALYVSYDVDLSTDEVQLLAALIDNMPYLGRSESWVCGRLVEATPEMGLFHCRAGEAPAPDCERLPLLAAMPEPAYADWRVQAIGRLPAEKPKSGDARVKRQAALNATYPSDLISALRVDSAQWQAEGWNQAPGSRWATYWRPLRTFSRRPGGSPAPARHRPADTAVLALSSDTRCADLLPPAKDAIRRMNALHQALVRDSARGGRQPSPCFIAKGADASRLVGHQHAYLIPLLTRTGEQIEKVLVYCRTGFDDAARLSLHAQVKTYAKDLPALYVTLVGYGAREEFARDLPCLGAHETWESATAFVPPRHLKRRGRNGLWGQVVSELAHRGGDAAVPPPARIELEVEGGGWVEVTEDLDARTLRPARRWRRFRRRREVDHPHGQPPVDIGFGLRLTFHAAVSGPIALGFGCHFGLGSFVPLSRSAAVPKRDAA